MHSLVCVRARVCLQVCVCVVFFLNECHERNEGRTEDKAETRRDGGQFRQQQGTNGESALCYLFHPKLPTKLKAKTFKIYILYSTAQDGVRALCVS